MKRLCFLFLLGILLPLSASSQTEMHYTVSIDTENQYLNVSLSIQNLSAEMTTLKMPVWAPGYYLILDYPKNLVDFNVTDRGGNSLPWEKSGKNGWIIHNGAHRELSVSYRIYANAQSVAECMVTREKAFIPGNGVYMHIEDQKELPVSVTFILPEEWASVSTGLERTSEAHTFTAADFDTLYDSPVYIGNQTLIHFTHEGHHYELALETPEGFEEQDFTSDLKKMISANTALIGDVPYKDYCFILMGRGGGGLEHMNSQACFTSGSFHFASRESYLSFFSFITHEYFHLYNVKAIRPVELGPFDYDREVFTPMLWVSEGFTVYYELPLMLRAGIIEKDYFLKEMSSYIRTIEDNEGKKHMSLRQSSYDIWLNFFNRNANGKETRISYYDKGPIIGFLMDIEIRQMTDNRKSLDDVMRALYYRYYKEQNRGFTEEEFWQTSEQVAGGALTEIRQYVDTTREIDYPKYMDYAGLKIETNWTLSIKEDCSGLPLRIRKSLLGE